MNIIKDMPRWLKEHAGIIALDRGKTLRLISPQKFRETLVDELVWTATFSSDAGTREAARWLIRVAAQNLGVLPASILPLYKAMGRGAVAGFSTPAINIRGLTYDVSRAILKVQKRLKAGPVVFEIARSEIGYTHQQPAEYATSVLAAAIKEGWQGPIFIQGDHFQVNAKKFAVDPNSELEAIRGLIREGIAYGFFNIDIDTSTLVDLSHPTVKQQQRLNYEICAEFTKFIRGLEPKGVAISVGGEIGEVGKKNTTVEEFEAYMGGYLETLGKGISEGISKISIQTGTSHGGIPLPDGTIAKVKIDFETLRKISEVARAKYGLAGAVQHGASTLAEDLFDHFPKNQTAEVHLATEFQNIIYNHPLFPAALKDEIHQYLRKTCADERKDGETEEQFLYKTRKKALGPFKQQMWSFSAEVRGKICATLEQKFETLFRKLQVVGVLPQVEKYVKPVEITPTAPALLQNKAA